MKLFRKFMAALLAVGLLAAFAACSGQGDKQADNKQADNEEFRFMQSESGQIRQADLDCFVKRISLTAGDDPELVTPAEGMLSLALMRAELLEAESLDLAVSLEETQQWAADYYAGLQEQAAAGTDPDAKEQWDWTQAYMQKTQMSEEDYLEYIAFNRRAILAEQALSEKMSPDMGDNYEAQSKAYNEYMLELLEKHRDQLVEEDLMPLLDEAMENLKA